MNIEYLHQTAQHVRQKLECGPVDAGLILGSGWGNVADAFEPVNTLNYKDIPGMYGSGIPGHAGRILTVRAGNKNIVVFQGRHHWYEGLGWEPVALPVYICIALRVPVLLLTNAAGGIREDLTPGSFMLVDDHINAMGVNPLVGCHDPALGERFPDLSRVYSPRLNDLMESVAKKTGQVLRHGIYAAVSGPNYETPAEVSWLRQAGTDAVGMSTVPEAILARAAGLELACISCITNRAAGLGPALSHEEVLLTTRRISPVMHNLLSKTLSLLEPGTQPPTPSFSCLPHPTRKDQTGK